MMLDAFIIEELRRREDRRREQERPVLELPIDAPERGDEDDEDEQSEDPKRGVVIIDL